MVGNEENLDQFETNIFARDLDESGEELFIQKYLTLNLTSKVR